MVGQNEGSGANDPSALRISDAERHQVAEVLREAAGEGRLDLEELDESLEATYAARTYADLVPITLDLPGGPASTSTPAVPYATTPAPRASGTVSDRFVSGPASEQHLAIMSGVNRKGVWIVPELMNIVAVMGGADLDLRQARFAAREVTINVNCFMGGAQIKVGPDVHVVMEGVGIMGGFQGPGGEADQAGPDAPVVHVKGVAIWGGVEVKRKR